MDAKAAQKLSGMGGGDDDEAVFQKLRTTKLAPEDKQAIAVQRQRYESPLKMPHPSGGDDSHDGQDGEKSIAGRKKIPAGQSQVSLEDMEDPEVEAELNAILKRSPSMLFYFISAPALFVLTDSVFSSFFPSFSREMQLLVITPLTHHLHLLTHFSSHNILQILLPLQRKSQIHPPEQTQHHPPPFRRRARYTPARRAATRGPCAQLGAQNRA